MGAKLTAFRVATLKWLADAQDKYPQNDCGFWPTYRHKEAALCRRVLEPAGLVKVNRIAANSFRYAITEAGRRALTEEQR